MQRSVCEIFPVLRNQLGFSSVNHRITVTPSIVFSLEVEPHTLIDLRLRSNTQLAPGLDEARQQFQRRSEDLVTQSAHRF